MLRDSLGRHNYPQMLLMLSKGSKGQMYEHSVVGPVDVADALAQLVAGIIMPPPRAGDVDAPFEVGGSASYPVTPATGMRYDG